MRQRLGRYDPAILDALREIEGSDPKFETQEISIQSLLERLETIQGCRDRGEGNETRDRAMPGYLILAEDVWSRNGILLLSKGQELTPHLLQRLRNLAQGKSIQANVRVQMPVAQQIKALKIDANTEEKPAFGLRQAPTPAVLD
jgi:hypothetical protein